MMIVSIIVVSIAVSYGLFKADKAYFDAENSLFSTTASYHFVRFLEIAGAFVCANVLSVILAKPVPIATFVLVTITFWFVIYLIIKVKMLTDREGILHKREPRRLLLALTAMSIPLAICFVRARASLKGLDFLNGIKTVKSLVLDFALIVAATAIVCLLRYLKIAGYFDKFVELLRDDPEAQRLRRRMAGEGTREVHSSSWLKRNFLYLLCVVLVLAVFITCAVVLVKYI